MRTAMIAMTTSNSINVNPRCFRMVWSPFGNERKTGNGKSPIDIRIRRRAAPARQSNIQRANGLSGKRESRIREHLSLAGAWFLALCLRPVELCPGLVLGFRRLADLDMGVVLSVTATQEHEWREKREVQ